MHLSQLLSGVDWLAVIIATISAFALGAAWYSPALFGNTWLRDVGLTKESIDGANKWVIFGGTFLLLVVSAAALSAWIEGGWLQGLHAGLWIGLFWLGTACGITYLFEQRPFRLWLINGGYYIALYALMGVIIGILESV